MGAASQVRPTTVLNFGSPREALNLSGTCVPIPLLSAQARSRHVRFHLVGRARVERPNSTIQPRHQHQQLSPLYNSPNQLPYYDYDTAQQAATSFHADHSNNIDLDFDADRNCPSLSSSPISTQSLLSQYSGIQAAPLSTFDSIPTIAVPRLTQGSLFDFSQSNQTGLGDSNTPLFPDADPMQTDAWAPSGQLTPRSTGRISHHHRESSLSSLGSTTGPASPYSHSTSNPHIAVTDSLGDGYHGLPNADDFNYQLATKSLPSVQPHDTFYANYSTYGPTDNTAITTYPHNAATPKRKNERGLLQPPEPFIGSSRSRPMSVASSITSDSPATPSGELEDDSRRRSNAINTVPKLDRTMTDIYSDELYSPSFNITSSVASQAPRSPGNNELFNQRLQAANSHNSQQLLSVAQSPVATISRGRSPFRNGSPLAPVSMHDFSSTMSSPQMRFSTAQQIREQNKAAQDALQQQMSRTADTSTPQTISPKDALLDFQENDGEPDFPLFPQQNSNRFNSDSVSKNISQNQQTFNEIPMDTTALQNYFASQLPTNIQIPQQYPFIAQPRQQSSVPSLSNESLAPSRMSPAEIATTESAHSNSPQRPAVTSADGGTYTCTYHGCTLRFETPALLQKHKREGHRQAHSLIGPHRSESVGVVSGMTTTLLNSQAGPHRCDRTNPSTGKPCNTIFSRPYDLTRHEDTIHNARKQKVRCDLCTDEKTFSRADALTRHYRVCHPDVEFHGKQRRRGGQSG
ncbi:hypothetical protein B0T17DRAFT_30930 [Bombardia bombarda]|uniref:C2H2-type domain-containing protein n=1 Tax=Bombardia bombarda TaxID=252184 RepID=A0AA40CF37_9PEZI|nr:hypothetical protein B0T17DRAFT_30930 [Bombardia bombarda]